MVMRTIRVRVHAGHLEPVERLPLSEGTELAVHFEEPPRRGSPSAIVAAMDMWPDLDPTLFEELEQAIERGKLPDPGLLDGRSLTISTVDSLKTTIGVGAATPGWSQPVHWTRIVPGDSSHSLLVQLISHRGTNNPVGGQMPPIDSAIVDTDDVAKVLEWINKMPSASTIDAGAEPGVGTNMEGGTDATMIGDAASEASLQEGAIQAE
jgi:hypothetical protein